MKMQIQKWGNSLAIRIPRALAVESQIEQGAEVNVTVIEGKLVITPVTKKSCNLEELVAGITEENRHSEVDTEPAQGDEVW